METRTIQRPSSIAGVRYAAPERLMRSAHACVWASSASPVRPGGSCRTQSVCSGTGASTRQCGRRARPLRQPLRVCHVAAQARLQAADPLLADQEPELQRAEAASQREAPVAQVLHLLVGGGAQIARAGGHDANQVLGIAHVIQRAIEGHAEPLVRIEHQRIGAFDAVPHPAAFGQDHRATRPWRRRRAARGRIARAIARHRGDRVERGGRRGPGRADDRARLASGSEIGADGLFQGIGAQRVVRRRWRCGGRCRGRSRRAARPYPRNCDCAPRCRPPAAALRPAARRGSVRNWWRARGRRAARPACRWTRCPESRRSTRRRGRSCGASNRSPLLRFRSARGWTARRGPARRGRSRRSRRARWRVRRWKGSSRRSWGAASGRGRA